MVKMVSGGKFLSYLSSFIPFKFARRIFEVHLNLPALIIPTIS